MRRNNKYPDEFKEKVVKDYLNGMSRRQVMDKYDINAHSTITRWVKKWKETKSFPDDRGKGSKGRPKKIKKEEMTKDEYIEYLEMKLEIKKYMAFYEKRKQR